MSQTREEVRRMSAWNTRFEMVGRLQLRLKRAGLTTNTEYLAKALPAMKVRFELMQGIYK
jgi:hypothetical protein